MESIFKTLFTLYIAFILFRSTKGKPSDQKKVCPEIERKITMSNDDDDDDDIPYDDEDANDDDDEQGDCFGEEENSQGSDGVDVSGEIIEFSILSYREIRARVDADISEISSLLSVSNEAALVLLCKHGWDVDNIHEEWFSDEAKTRTACGLTVSEVSSGPLKKELNGTFFCGICLDNCEYNSIDDSAFMAGCGHVYCETCWRTYVRTAIKDGAGSLFLRCPEPSCRASIGDMISSLASDENKVMYENHVLRSYIESRKKIKYCPGPGCEFAVECLARDLSNCKVCDFEVTCNCSYGLCWNCSEEAHSPVDCETVAKWLLKNSSESENTDWILANTKPCPRCSKAIEKTQGCMHMICAAPCKFEFCWLCLAPWSEHLKIGGEYYGCNVYREAEMNGEYSKEEKIREMAKKSLERYTHYYERWNSNRISRKKAMADKEMHFEKLSDIHHLTEKELQTIRDAWVQVVESRRVLMWSYTYGYYLPQKEPGKKAFFEYLQGEAESTLERLHGLVEVEILKHCIDGASSTEFMSFKANAVDLTKITREYFQNLVRA